MSDGVETSGPEPRDLTRSPADTAVSPELILVDPDQAAKARAALPDPQDTLERLGRSLLAASSSADLRRPTRETVPPQAQPESVPEQEPQAVQTKVPTAQRASRSRHARRWVLAACGIAAVALALALDARIVIGERSAGSGPTAGGRPTVARSASIDPRPAESTAPQRRQGTTPRAGAATDQNPRSTRATAPAKRAVNKKDAALRSVGRRFAWAPVRRASSYHVEFFRGDARIFAAGTKRPKISMPARWSFRGKPESLRPGEYRWYVWPVFDGTGRAPAASVQARLVVE